MSNQEHPNDLSPPRTLRLQAEEMLNATQTDVFSMSSHETRALVHELQVHQMELEVQNEQLRLAQLRLAESHDRYSSLYEFAPVGYVTLDAASCILEANFTAATLLGVARAKLTGVKFSDFVARQSQDEFYLHQRAVLFSETKQFCELPMHMDDGSPLLVRLESVRYQNDIHGIEQFCVALIDVSETKHAQQAEQMLRKHEERLDLALSAGGFGIWDTNLSTGELTVDQRWAAILGYALEEIGPSSTTWDTLIHPDDLASVKQASDLHLRGQVKAFSREFRMKTKSGQWMWVCSRGRVTERDDSGKPLRLTGTLSDISERKNLEREVVETAAEEQRRIGQELHDGIGGDLTGIGFTVQGLIEDLGDAGIPQAAIAKKVGEELDRVTEQVRLLSHGLNPVEVDCHGLTVALARLAKRTKKLYRIDCEFHHEAPVEINNAFVADHLYRIAQEAVTNAVKHGNPREIVLRLDSRDDKLVLQVVDDGNGIDPKDLATDGIGLRNMRYRAGLIGADLRIDRIAQGGTRVHCQYTTDSA